MRHYWLVPAIGIALAAPAWAQDDSYETPQYTTTPSTLEKDYGLPTFGSVDAFVAQQKTQAPQPEATSSADPLARPPDRPLPSTSDAETPLYTTGGDTALSDSSTDTTGEAAAAAASRMLDR